MRKSWLAVSLEDFHSKKKKWQGGNECFVRCRVVGGKSMAQAIKTAQTEDGPWLLAPLHVNYNISYRRERDNEQVNPA